GNSASSDDGGGLENDGTATLTVCTLSANSASSGGGLENDGTATLTDTIVAGNTRGSGVSSDIGGTNVSGSDNLIGTGGSGGLTDGESGNIVGVADPLLAPLGNYGGPTQTMALLPGSPALGAGIAVTGVTTDQRGEPLDSPEPDIGAFQSQGFTLTPAAGSTPQSAATGTPFAVPLAVTVAANNPVEPVAGGVLTFTAPAGGPSANLSATTATIRHNGLASVTAAANASVGSYAVTASAGGNGTDFDLKNTTGTLISLAFSGITDQTIIYGTTSVTISGALANGSQAPAGETVAVTLDSVEQSATIGSGGAFSTTFNTAGLTVAGSPYTITYAYASDGTFTSASTTSTLTVKPATPIIFTVNSLGDAGIGSNDAGDLRYCINQANADDQANQIVFDPSVFGTPRTITLSGGQLELKDTLGTQTITGPAVGVTISGGGNSRVFQVDPGVTASISGLTISGGSAAGLGGGLVNYGTATLTDCTLSGNTCVNSDADDAHCDGGAVFNGQTAPNYYGKIYGAANLTLTSCTLSGNSASGDAGGGGGVFNSGTATLTDCTVSGNSSSAAGGGGLANDGLANDLSTITLTNCTVSGNSAYSGGGVYNFSGTANLTDCTVSGNSSATGGGGLENDGYALTPATLTDTIVAGNTDPSGASDIAGGDVSGSDNLLGTGGSGGLANGVDGNIVLTSLTDLGLAPLGNYGGPTQTIALLSGSPAIGAGVIADYPGTTTPITTDQRGEPLDTPNPDIGAFQTQGFPLIALTFSGISNPSITYGTSSVTISGTLANGLQGPVGERVAVTLGGVQQSATIRSGGAFSTTFNADGLTVAGSPYTVNYAYTSDGTFASAGTTSTLTDNPATLTITADRETKGYGTADPALAYTATGFEFSDTAGSVLTGALARAEAGTVGGEQAGGYAITHGTLAADSNYTIEFTGKTLTITPATLTVTANAQTKVYGATDPILTDTVTGLVETAVDGVTIADTAATVLSGALARAQAGTLAGEQAGSYPIAQGTLAAASNYQITFTGSALTITPAALTVATNPQTKVYGTNDPALTVTTTGLVNTTVDGVAIDDTAASVLTGTLARSQAGTLAGEQVGDYAIAQGTLAADSNYTLSFTANTLTITQAALTVVATPQGKVYGTADPNLTDSATGLIDTSVDGVTIDDTAATVVTGALARAQSGTAAGEQVGDYAIAQGTLAANSDYTIHFAGSTLTITPATLTVTAEPETKVFGSADPALAYAAGGFQFDDTAATVLSGHLARAAGETVAGGPYAITQGTLAADGNYTIQFTGSTLMITGATPLVTESAPGGTYTGAPIAATVTVTGVGGTATPVLEGVTPTLAYYAGTGTSGTDLGSAAPSAAGAYTVVARFPGSADYAAAHSEPATFVIAPVAATIILTSPSSSPVYGQAVTFVATVTSAGGAPGGTVTFADGNTPLATVPLDGSGQAAVTISTMSLGSHAITATYNGGTDFRGVKSGTAAESVSRSATAIVLVPHAVLRGKKALKGVELTAEIEPVAPGGGVPTGQVIFEFVKKHRKKVTVKTLGTAELSGGEATLTFKPNQVLKKPLTIVYSGDPDFLGSMMSPPKLTKSGIASSGI
ncbi:MAG: beta strand repeat-containing protein, partial [Isosphaerales bacterium]